MKVLFLVLALFASFSVFACDATKQAANTKDLKDDATNQANLVLNHNTAPTGNPASTQQ